MQLVAIIVSLALTAAGFALFGRALLRILRFLRLGAPAPEGLRTASAWRRTAMLGREFAAHTRMNRWGVVGVAHWFVAVGFYALLITLVNATGQLFSPDWLLPVIGDWTPYNVLVEFLATGTALGILVLIAIRQLSRPDKPGRKSRFTGSRSGQAYFVEAVIVIVSVCIVVLHALEGALHHADGYQASFFVSYPLVARFRQLDTATLHNLVYLVACVKITTSYVWMITVSLKTDMGIAWHRFLAFPNIWFKRNATGETSLGALLPMTSGG
ncbi:Fe-S oxidoreductase, partial [Streptomyces sp. SAS_260]